ncbi:MAG: response regulator transcription factor [Peptococcaceae bacterium]|nr:response regulator transcription factor [Peptococcaceae bacterium]
MHTILLVEDDADIARNLSALLAAENYQVTIASGQKIALQRISETKFDLLLVDISLPDGSGYAVCTAAKRANDTPVIFLTAADDEVSVVTGFDMGADDYIAKPFRPMELLSRVKSVLRRRGKTQSLFEVGSITIDTVRGTVHKHQTEVFLSALEYRILLVFLNNKGIVLTRSRLLEEIWDVAGEYVNDNTLTVYIKRLREKIEDDPQNPDVIKTVRGLGYRLGN